MNGEDHDVALTPWARHERDQRRRERASTTLIERLRWLEEMLAFADTLSARARDRQRRPTNVVSAGDKRP